MATTPAKKPAPAKKASTPTAKKAPAAKAGQTNSAVSVQPLLNQQQHAPAPTQKFGTVSQRLPIGLDEKTRQASVEMLNQMLADTITLRDMYKKQPLAGGRPHVLSTSFAVR